MSSITFRHKGDFSKTEKFLGFLLRRDYLNVLEQYGREGVLALSSATPKDSGNTASLWSYEIKNGKGCVSLSFHNSNIQNGVNIAVLLQYGHGTKNGGYVAGRDYINPAIQPVFDRMADRAFQEITRR